MASKRKTRELALQLLFLWDAHGQASDETAIQVAEDICDDATTRSRGIQAARGAWDNHEQADRWVERLAPQWPPRRQPGVDRGILRLAIWELTHTDTPPKVVIDEAIELAKVFSTENSPAFINGVMDAVLKEHRLLTARPE